MFEDSKEYVVPSQDPLRRSFSNNTVIGDIKTNVEVDGCTVTKAAQKAVLDAQKAVLEALIDNAILDLCFEVHREAKLIPALFTIPYQLIQTYGKNVKSMKSVARCYICGATKGPNNFATHLLDCMVPQDVETNSRKARTKMINFKEVDSDEEGTADFSEKNKKRAKGKGNSSSKSPYNSAQSFMNMSFGERKAFFDKKCGVVTRRSKNLCLNSHKCSIHTDIQRTNVRDDMLRDEPDNGQIDVDTLNKSDIKMAFNTDGNMSDYPSGSLAYF